MHAKGSGAFGTFTVTKNITQYTRAKLFEKVGKKAEMFAPFTTVAGERGAADAERDIRGFALKFYTEEGNWDMVGNNTPVFFIRDPRQLPDLNKAVKHDPKTNLRSATSSWDYWTLLPEALHQITIVMSDRGIPASYRHMHGFGSHTYSFWNAKNERFWVKFHFKTQQGIKNLTDAEAEALIGKDRESHQRDLFDAIARGDFPKWTMFVQVMPEKDAEKVAYHPFDLTKVWPQKDYPLIEVGKFELNKNPENFFTDVERSAFAPSNLVPGISVSPDRMLQARLINYADAQHWSFHQDDSNYFEQPRKLFQLMNDAQKEALFGNTARGMGDAALFVKYRHIRNCHAADTAYAAGVAKAMGLDLQAALASKKDDPMNGNPLVALPV